VATEIQFIVTRFPGEPFGTNIEALRPQSNQTVFGTGGWHGTSPCQGSQTVIGSAAQVDGMVPAWVKYHNSDREDAAQVDRRLQ